MNSVKCVTGSSHCGDAAKAPVAPPELLHGPRQVDPVEVGPHRLCEEQLGVGTFPEQEVAQPLLAASADRQIDIRRVDDATAAAGHSRPDALAGDEAVEAAGGGGVDVWRRGRSSRSPVARGAACRVPSPFRSPRCRLTSAWPTRSRRPITLSRTSAWAQRAALAREIRLKQPQKAVDFGSRALPVVRGERVGRQRRDAVGRRGFNRPPQRLHAQPGVPRVVADHAPLPIGRCRP